MKAMAPVKTTARCDRLTRMRPFPSSFSVVYTFIHQHQLHTPSTYLCALHLLPMSSPGPDDGAVAVCCMCGDHGMPQELFRCKLCRLRLQHRYCSELYPKAATYQQCNWCLRQGGRGGSPSPVAAKKRMITSPEANDSDENKRRRSSGGCSRSAFCTELDKPVKKPPKARDERAVLPMRETETTAKGRKPQAAAEKARFRVKVRRRRYKLLAEVIISC